MYGYSWDMMVHSWDTILVVVKVVDNKSGNEHFLDPQAWTQNDRWSKHSDMCLQYASCLKDNLISDFHRKTNFMDQNLFIQDVWVKVFKNRRTCSTLQNNSKSLHKVVITTCS